MTCKKDGFTLAHQNHASSSRKRVGHGVGACRKCRNEGGHATTDDDGNGNRLSFKKGPWTAEEDALLIEYVKNHGERHWNCVQKTGLMRCGKSCRLRWTNHLRPDLKKGTFSPEEERVVLDLHAKLGNKWSKIAAELPGRTDNEVKNFWNTKIKRRMKANLLTTNSEENPLKKGVTFRQQLQPLMYKKSLIQQEISSMPNSFISSYQNPTLIPSTPTLHEQNLGKSNLNLINSSQISDPILSFLNNPSYKFQLFPKEDEEINYNVGSTSHDLPCHSHPHDLISSDVGSSNPIFLGKIDGSTSTTCTNMDLPYFQYFPMTSASELVTTRYGLNDVRVTSSKGKTSELEKSSITKEGKCVADETPNFDKGGEMMTTLEGHLISNARILDDHGHEYSCNEVMKPKEEELEELVSMDDDLSSLLYDFSTNSSPSPFNHSNVGGLSKFINREEASNTPSTTTNNPPAAFSISEFNWNMDNQCWSNTWRML